MEKTTHNQGYIRVKVDGKWVLEHRFVMEEKIGRKLLCTELVHHVDENKKNNSYDNLDIKTRVTHAILHGECKEIPKRKFTCDRCKCEFERLERKAKYQDKIGKPFKYCSLKCTAGGHENPILPVAQHGTLSMYTRGKCRCDLCRKAGTDWKREYLEKRSHSLNG